MEKEFFQSLNNAFNNYDKIFECCCEDAFYPEIVDRYLSTLLKYCIVTRNTPSHLTCQQMKAFNEEIKQRVPTAIEIDNILTNGYLSHSFYDEQNFISQYGFAYEDKVSDEAIKKRDEIYEYFGQLEKRVSKSPFFSARECLTPEVVDQEKFFTILGNKTIYYSSYAPERLYIGPINKDHFHLLPIVVGESKKDYLLRSLKREMDSRHCYKNKTLEIAKYVIDYYSKYPTYVAFIPIQDALATDFNTCHFNGASNVLQKYYNEMIDGKYAIGDMLSREYEDEPEFLDVGNLVTLEDNIKNIPLNIVRFSDWYDIRQEYLKKMNYADGTLVTFENCVKVDLNSDYYRSLKKYYKSL